jgi:hypothetical protein
VACVDHLLRRAPLHLTASSGDGRVRVFDADAAQRDGTGVYDYDDDGAHNQHKAKPNTHLNQTSAGLLLGLLLSFSFGVSRCSPGLL